MIDHSLVTGFTMFIRRSFDMTCFGISTYHRHEPPLFALFWSFLLAISEPGLTFQKKVPINETERNPQLPT